MGTLLFFFRKRTVNHCTISIAQKEPPTIVHVRKKLYLRIIK